jgi:hypothetical protein
MTDQQMIMGDWVALLPATLSDAEKECLEALESARVWQLEAADCRFPDSSPHD